MACQYIHLNPKDATTITVAIPTGESVALGTRLVSDLQENITIEDNKVKGTLKYIDNFEEFNSSNDTGNFLILKIEEATKGKKVTTNISGEGASGKDKQLDEDGIIIYHVFSTENKINITCDSATRTLELTDLVLKSADV